MITKVRPQNVNQIQKHKTWQLNGVWLKRGGGRKSSKHLTLNPNTFLIIKYKMLGILSRKKKLDLVIYFSCVYSTIYWWKNVLNLLIHDHNCLIIYHCRNILAFIIMQMCAKAKEGTYSFCFLFAVPKLGWAGCCTHSALF